MRHLVKSTAAAIALTVGATAANAEDFNLRIGSGHPPGVVYAGLMIDYFQAELTKRVAERTDHTVSFVEGYSGSIVKVTEVLEGVQDGIIDIGGGAQGERAYDLFRHRADDRAAFARR